MIRCIIIEDEHLAAAKLKDFVARIELLSLQQVFDNGTEAVNFILSHGTELIFLDICMPDLNGFQLLKALKLPPKVIITSADSSHALTGYEYNVCDYLLKPFGFDRFLKAVLKASDELGKTISSAEPSYIFVKTQYRNERIDLDEIRYIEGMKDYLSIVLAKRKIMTLMSFSDIMQLLPSSMFVRVHKSYIVSIDKIRSIEKSQLNIEDVSIPVSDTYRELFLNLLKTRKNMI